MLIVSANRLSEIEWNLKWRRLTIDWKKKNEEMVLLRNDETVIDVRMMFAYQLRSILW